MNSETKDFLLGTSIFIACFTLIAIFLRSMGTGEALALLLATLSSVYVTTTFLGEEW